MKKFFNMQPLSLLTSGLVTAVMAIAIASCSPNPENDPSNQEKNGASVNVVNDPAQLAKYVTNYKAPAAAKAAPRRVAQAWEDWTAPDLASLVANANVQLVANMDQNALNNGGVFVVPENTVFEGLWGGLNINANGADVDLVVLGKLSVGYLNLNGARNVRVYVGPNAEIVLPEWAMLLDGSNRAMYVYPGAKLAASLLKGQNGAKLYIVGDMTLDKDIEFGSNINVYIQGKLTVNAELKTNNVNLQAAEVEAQQWTFNNNSEINVASTVHITGDNTINAQNKIYCQEYIVDGVFHMENNSQLVATEHIQANNYFEVSTQGIIETPCLYVAQKLYIKNSATMNIGRYIYCNEFEASASGFTINMGGNALIRANKHFTIENKGWTIRFNNSADAQSAIVTNKFQIMEGQAAFISGYAFLSAAEYWGKPTENFRYYQEGDNYESYSLQETVKATINGVTVTSEPNDCTPVFSTLEDIPEPPTITELISVVSHTHDISATCVTLYNNKAYLSWHKRGTSIHGCLEALQVQNDIASLTSWMEVNDGSTEGGDNYGGNAAVSGADAAGESQGQFDFNHLAVAEGKVVTTGDNAKMGGFIGAIALDPSGNFGTNGTLQDAFKSRQLLGKVTEKVGRSGNVVMYANGRYYIACAGGFQEYVGNLDDLFTKGENGKWLASLGDYELTAGSAKHIAINPAGDKVVTLEFTSRSENKVDGDDYWFNDTETALNGKLKVRNADNWLNSTPDWEVEIEGISPIYGKNVVLMDADGMVYVSAGKQGLLVYKDGAKVGEFQRKQEYPAAGVNGVAIDDKYVYVAYGISGLWILDKSKLLAGADSEECVVSWYKSNAPELHETVAAAASANYIALDGQYIYVAYGRHGVKVLKLED